MGWKEAGDRKNYGGKVMNKQMVYRWLFRQSARLHTFFYLRCTHWAAKAEGGLHPKHRIMNYHQFFVDNLSPEDRVLDVGCGNGALTFAIASKAKDVVAVDIVAKKIEEAKKKYASGNIRYIHCDATSYDFQQAFDVITLSNVLEHIEHRKEFLIKLKELAPRFVIRVPMLTREWLPVYKKEMGIDGRLDDTHFIEYTEEEFLNEMTSVGLKVIQWNKQFGEIWAVVTK